MLVPLVRARAQVRVFPQGWRPDAEAFQPAALAGEWAQFEALLGRDIPSLTHAIIVLSRDTGELLNEGQRKDLWRAFRVPVFEQILAGNGSLLAAECEAHDGCTWNRLVWPWRLDTSKGSRSRRSTQDAAASLLAPMNVATEFRCVRLLASRAAAGRRRQG